MEKLTRFNEEIQCNETAVLLSPGYGAGWYSWHHIPELLYSPHIVNMVQQGMAEDINTSVIAIILSCTMEEAESICLGGAPDLEVVWVEEGLHFQIREYDGWETIVFKDDLVWEVA